MGRRFLQRGVEGSPVIAREYQKRGDRKTPGINE